MTQTNWNKSSKWIKKERTTDFIGTLPEGVATATLVQTKSSWSRPKQCKLGKDTMTLLVTKVDGAVETTPLSRDIYAAKKAAAELLCSAPKPTTPTELTAAQAQAMGLVYHDMNGDARGYCYCCGRTGFKVNAAGNLSFHGFTRPGWGYTEGGCIGTAHTPEETLDIALRSARSAEAAFADQLETDLVEATLERLRWEVRKSYNRRYKQRELDRFIEEGSDPKSSEVESTRRDIEYRRKNNLCWLAQLEEVKAAQV